MLLRLEIPGRPVLFGATSARMMGTPIPTILNPVLANPALLMTVGIAPMSVGSMMALSSAGGWPQ
jgi:hypothetical protein